ncbi:protein MFI isoform X1 [Xyrauchen texanus]|uniref:protein MFI isoform X1 n=1 Tax=Xyrauchen texanus TaxID=154827 RepID=UPI00224294FD|nr:protein MFI isoform X1 [Xyrauchen texanus]XP_051970384.1 protein MFI isoform X1 [Xyrauchen texanus]
MSKKMVDHTCSFDRDHTISQPGDIASESDKILIPEMKTIFSQAARIIQRTWRAHVDTAVFKHLKKLVSFHNQGDPHLLLRFINPAEANILDAASGVLVRFRLGGTTFPPNIYYKIYTRAPIVDLCASSPKDYKHAWQKKPVPSQIHNGQPMVCDDDHSGWYQRVENNGWRILSCKISMIEDPITQSTNCKKTEFHHCKIHRRQDVARKKKIRKIQWMRKMYAEGLLLVSRPTDHRETALLEEKCAQRMINSLEQVGPDSISEQEVDELLAWTNALNFDEYANEWRDLGTSKCCIFNKGKTPRLCPTLYSVLSTILEL